MPISKDQRPSLPKGNRVVVLNEKNGWIIASDPYLAGNPGIAGGGDLFPRVTYTSNYFWSGKNWNKQRTFALVFATEQEAIEAIAKTPEPPPD
jgi:hypothetical protein